jgi:O-antigen/teichoic acid export membrane protein
MIMVLHGTDAVLALPLGLAVGSAVSVVCSWPLLEPRFRNMTRVDLRQLRAAWTESIHFWMVGLTTQIQRADVAVVSALAGPAAAGTFAVPARLVGPLLIFPNAYSMALFPRIASAHNRRLAHREAARGQLLLLAGMSVLLGGLFVLAPLAVQIVLGAQYLQTVGVLRVYLLGLLVASLNQPMAIFLQAEGAERFVARIVTPASLAGLAGIAIGASVRGAFGAAFGFLLLHVLAGSFLLARSMSVLRDGISSKDQRAVPELSDAVKRAVGH